MGMEHWIRLRGETVVFTLPCRISLKAIPIEEVFELFFMMFVASPGGVSQLLRDEIEAGPRLGI